MLQVTCRIQADYRHCPRSVRALARLLTEVRTQGTQHAGETLGNGQFLEVPEFTGVKETAVAGWTTLIVNVRLVLVDHMDHPHLTLGAAGIAETVESGAFCRIADIDGFRALHTHQVFLLQHVEPETTATGAALNLYVVEHHNLKIASAF